MGKFTKDEIIKQKETRLGLEKINKQGYLMRIIKYNGCQDVIVEFQDKFKTKVNCEWKQFNKGTLENPAVFENRINEERYNNQGCLMKIIEYYNSQDIVVEFQDNYKARVHAQYRKFILGGISNPYFPSVCGVGMIGEKYSTRENGKTSKEYATWQSMLSRAFSEKVVKERPTYKDVICCNEWLLYENFYDWLHSQENFDKWKNNKGWHLDKDILVKGNKLYSPETCCLVPQYINVLFTCRQNDRGDMPLGVTKDAKQNRYIATTIYGKKNNKALTTAYRYPTPEDAFYLGYKPTKEAYIKEIAQEEYELGNITKKCYEAMMNYEVEITD